MPKMCPHPQHYAQRMGGSAFASIARSPSSAAAKALPRASTTAGSRSSSKPTGHRPAHHAGLSRPSRPPAYRALHARGRSSVRRTVEVAVPVLRRCGGRQARTLPTSSTFVHYRGESLVVATASDVRPWRRLLPAIAAARSVLTSAAPRRLPRAGRQARRRGGGSPLAPQSPGWPASACRLARERLSS
jgi:hypothetical protein